MVILVTHLISLATLAIFTAAKPIEDIAGGCTTTTTVTLTVPGGPGQPTTTPSLPPVNPPTGGPGSGTTTTVTITVPGSPTGSVPTISTPWIPTTTITVTVPSSGPPISVPPVSISTSTSISIGLPPVSGPPGGGSIPTTTVTVTGPGSPTGTGPGSTPSAIPPSQCSTGDLQCCDTVEPATSSGASSLLGLLGISLTDTNVLVGLTCIPINIIGIGTSGTCSAQTVCCENNSFGGLISLGCTPVNVGL